MLRYPVLMLASVMTLAVNSDIEQISLALTAEPDEMSVTWIVMEPFKPGSVGSVTWWPSANAAQQLTANASSWTYTAGPFGWNGTIFQATMTGLIAGAQYTYEIQGRGEVATRSFKAPPVAGPDVPAYMAVTADMGTVQLSGFLVAAEIIREHVALPFDLALIAGDLSYATTDPPKNELQGFWDDWGRQNEPFTSTAPWMTTVGNHESTPGFLTNASGTFPLPFAAFSARYVMPRNGNANFWFSYTYGPVTFVSMDTEDPYSPGSPQWQWVNATLGAVDRTVTPWLFLVLHRPVLSSDTSEEGAHIPGSGISAALEPMLFAHHVDVVLQGHQHCYERSAAQFNGTVFQRSDAFNVYKDPGAPIYMLQATAGAVLDFTHGWIEPQPDWSEVRHEIYYGFGRMNFTSTDTAFTLAYDFVDKDGIVRDHFSLVKTR